MCDNIQRPLIRLDYNESAISWTRIMALHSVSFVYHHSIRWHALRALNEKTVLPQGFAAALDHVFQSPRAICGAKLIDHP